MTVTIYSRISSLKCSRLSHLTRNGQKVLARTIFSKTGEWPQKLEHEHLHEIEKHWKPLVPKLVQEAQNEIETSGKKPTYILSMFPYPSGQLHMGHVRVYAISDAMAHHHRLMRQKVIHPMGWDAFGLPAENAAIERKVQPEKWTKENIKSMKSQLEDLACIFDWDREFATCDPKYYKWTQYLFVQMFKHGLAYQKEALVNWDPVDQTVLADEQVDEEGKSWRSGAQVEKKLLKQWFLRTRNYSKALYESLDDESFSEWKEIVKIQRNWIGECNGTNVEFQVDKSDFVISAWTDRPDLVHGTCFIGIRSDHPLANKESLMRLTMDKGEKSLEITVLKSCAIHPFTKDLVPILVIENLDPDQPEAFLGLHEHNDLDAQIAKICNIHYKPKALDETTKKNKHFSSIEEAMEALKSKKIGGFWMSKNFNDWLISRQRYWGTPIPIIHCSACGSVPVPEADLPVILPTLETLSVKGKSPLLQAESWIQTTCPSCGAPAKRETDTMDTFVDSSWYFARYLDAQNDQEVLSKEASKSLPVDLYIGGKEHALLHLYFARFFTHFMFDLGLSPVKEPFKDLLVQGMVKGKSYKLKNSGQYLSPKDAEKAKGNGEVVIENWEKMSKSKHNGVDPGLILEKYGSDTTKLLILSDVSPQGDRKWNPEDSYVRIKGMQEKLWGIVQSAIEVHNNPKIPKEIPKEQYQQFAQKMWDSRNFYLRGINHAYRNTKNLAMVQARIQGCLNDLWKCHGVVKRDSSEFQRALGTAIIALTPMAPHFCAELWHGLSQGIAKKNCSDFQWDKSIFHQTWPEVDGNYNVNILVNRNHELVATIPIALWKFRTLTSQEAFDIACCSPEVQEEILPWDFEYKFNKLEDYEGTLNFSVKLTDELRQKIKEKKMEEKRKKKERKEAKKARNEKR